MYFPLRNSALSLLFLFLILSSIKSFADQTYGDDDFFGDVPNFYLDQSRFDQDNVLVLQVNVSNTLILDETIVGYAEGNQVFLSLKDFSRILEFPITFQSNNMIASGWFVNERNTFFLDLDNNKCVIKDRKYNLSQNDVVIFGDDIFVNAKTLRKWFGFAVVYSTNDQEVIISSAGVLPLEQKFERGREWGKVDEEKERQMETKKEELEDENQEVIKNNYKLISFPFGDVTYTENYAKTNDASNSTSQLNALLAGDLLYLNNQLFITVQDKQITNFRLTAGRKDPEGKLLGPMGATDFSLGDVYTPEVPLAVRSQAGKGATISNYPLEYVSQFNKVVIRGNAQTGWDVELYRNNSLLDFKKVSNQGIYEFIDVPLVAGMNIIRLVFYGPFGQKYEEIRKFSSGGDLLKEDKLYYRFAANKNNEDFINIKKDLSTTGAPVINNSDGVRRIFTELGYGLTENTSVVGSFLQVPVSTTEEQTTDFASVSLRSSLFGVTGRLDNIRNLDDDFDAQQLSLQTSFLDNYSLTSVFERYAKEFISETNQTSSDPLLTKGNIRFDGPLKIPFTSFPARISITAIQENFNSKNSRNDIENEVSLGLTRKLSVTQNIKYINDERLTDENRNTVTGRTLFSYLFSDKLSIRSTVSYDIQPETDFTSTDISTSYNFGDSYNWTFSVSRQFGRDDQDDTTRYSSALAKTFDKFMLSLGGNYQDQDDYGMNVSVSTSFGYDPKNNIGVLSGIPLANSGAVAAKVFLDDNNNGIFDKGEGSLEGVEVATSGGKRIKTNSNGVALLTNINLNGVTKVSVNSDSLPDPFLMVRKKNIKIISHSGTIGNIYFPVSRVGEIGGYIVTDKGDGTINPASNVEIQLIDQNDTKVVYNSKSGYDGYYVFEMVPFGKYKAVVSLEQAKRLGFYTNTSHDVELNNNNETISDSNFIIKYGATKGIVGKISDIIKKVTKFKFGGTITNSKNIDSKLESVSQDNEKSEPEAPIVQEESSEVRPSEVQPEKVKDDSQTSSSEKKFNTSGVKKSKSSSNATEEKTTKTEPKVIKYKLKTTE